MYRNDIYMEVELQHQNNYTNISKTLFWKINDIGVIKPSVSHVFKEKHSCNDPWMLGERLLQVVEILEYGGIKLPPSVR